MNFDKKYYISTFFWSIFQKVIAALYAFISVPILLDFYGKSSYGLLAVATSCNAYMHLLDLGMNQGATRFFSRWRTEGKNDMINRVARTNISFYAIISLINIVLLLALAYGGRNLFSVTDSEFIQLRSCLWILAIFSLFSWGTTTYNQLLIADGKLSYTLKLQCVVTFLKCFLVASVLLFRLPLTVYFFFLTAIIASLIVPYMWKCRHDRLIDSILPANYWKDFKVVLTFSLSLFALSIFQMTAKDTRPIILSMFAVDGAGSVAEYSIIGAIPQLIIMVGGTFSGIFLPKTSSMVVKDDKKEIADFAYKWTLRTTIVMSIIAFPFMICAKELLSAYVGSKYSYLAPWLIIWCATVLIQNHTAPLSSLIYGYGKTKMLVIVTAISCVISMILNATLCKIMGVGSAVVGYAIYVVIIIGMFYIYFNKKILHLNRLKVLICFLKPVAIASVLAWAVSFIDIESETFFNISNNRIFFLFVCIVKSLAWLVPFIAILQFSRIIDFRTLFSKNG